MKNLLNLSRLCLLFILIQFINTVAWSFEFTVFHTNDLHSHFMGTGPDLLYTKKSQDGDPVKGHYARLATVINQETSKIGDSPYLLVDAGDWYGGTFFHILGPLKSVPMAPELEFFIHQHYDYTIFGNHEFDAGEIGLFNMLEKIMPLREKVAPKFKIISSNIEVKEDHPLKKFFNGPNPLVVSNELRELKTETSSLRLGIIGLTGVDAARVCLNNRPRISFVGFNDQKSRPEEDELFDLVKKQIALLKASGAQAIMVIIHAGTPEDELLAREVPEIDLIVAGHTHELYPTPKKIGKTLIAQAGFYGQWLGQLKLSWVKDHLELVSDKTNHIVDDQVEADEKTSERIESYTRELDSALTYTGKKAFEKIFLASETIGAGRKNPENSKLVTNALRDQLSKSLGETVDIYFTSLGLIRSGINAPQPLTPQSFNDVFRILSIGIDHENFRVGAKVARFYFTKREIRLLINFMEIYSLISKNFRPAFSDDITYRVRKWGIPMWNRLADLKWRGIPYDQWPELMSLASNSVVAGYLDKVQGMSYGLVSFTPKDKNGKEIEKIPYIEQTEFELLADYLLEKKVFP